MLDFHKVGGLVRERFLKRMVESDLTEPKIY